MSKLSNDVLIVLSPHSLESLQYSNYNIDEIRFYIGQYKSMIQKYNFNVLDLTFDFEKEDFLDILHLSIKGHIKMSQKILNHYNRVK